MVKRRHHLDTRDRLFAGCAFSICTMAAFAAQAQLVSGTGSLTSTVGLAPVITTSGTVTDISLGAARTILNWSSFGLGADQTAVYRFQDPSWIVLNRVSGPTLIDGRIEAMVGGQPNSGNVWFAAPGGVIFGPNARVNVGGLLATTGSIAQAAFLDPNNLSFSFTGANAAGVQIRSGAELKSGTGPLALISGDVAADSRSSVVGGSILYAAANDFTVRFAPLPGGLDLLDFIVPAGGGTISAATAVSADRSPGTTVLVTMSSALSPRLTPTNKIPATTSAISNRPDTTTNDGVHRC